jgi:hypothetical protein
MSRNGTSGHAMMDYAFHAGGVRLLRSSRALYMLALYMLALWRQRDEESMANAIGGCSAALPKSRFHDRIHKSGSLPD